jgi:hypothetical protein
MLSIAAMTGPQVRQEWGWIRNGLLEIIGRCQERYSPEDVWVAILGKDAYVWRITLAHDDIGFLVLRQQSDPDGPVLFIWCVWAEPGALAKHSAELFERLKEVAHRIGAVRLRMESSRKGWAALPLFDERAVIYEAEV